MSSVNVNSKATPDSELVEQVVDDLRRAFDCPSLSLDGPPNRLGGGFWADLFAVRLGYAPDSPDSPDGPDGLRGPRVMRIMPQGVWALREVVVHRHVDAASTIAPKLRATGVLPDGRPYLVMDQAPGAPLLAGLSLGKAVVGIPRIVRTLPAALAAAMHVVHGIELGHLAADIRAQVPDVPVVVDEMLPVLRETNAVLDDPLLARANDWLAETRRPGPEVVLCHGDLHPFNLLVDRSSKPGVGGDGVGGHGFGGHGDGGTPQTTLVDWTAAMIAEPEFDVAFTSLLLEFAPIPVPKVVVPAIGSLTRFLARRFRVGYEGHGHPLDADRLRWFTAYHAVRVLTEVANWRHAGELQAKAGHPFVFMAPLLENRLESILASPPGGE